MGLLNYQSLEFVDYWPNTANRTIFTIKHGYNTNSAQQRGSTFIGPVEPNHTYPVFTSGEWFFEVKDTNNNIQKVSLNDLLTTLYRTDSGFFNNVYP